MAAKLQRTRMLHWAAPGFLLLLRMVHGAELEIQIANTFAGQPLRMNAACYVNPAGERFSVSRLSYLLGGFALEKTDGSWLELTNHFAWMDEEAGRASTRLVVPAGKYRAVRWEVGLRTNVNHGNPALLAAAHPLNPNLNRLHWNWQGGYVFLALEGRWEHGNVLDGFSYHLAGEDNRVRVELRAPVSLATHERIEIEFDVAAVLGQEGAPSFTRDGNSTHSRPGDALAGSLRTRLPLAFRLQRVAAGRPSIASGRAARPDLPAQFAPYRFVFNAAFPRPELPPDNPLTEEGVALGRRLFNDPLLSRDGSIACASCHERRAGYSDPRRFSTGVSNRLGARQAMPLLNLAWKKLFFWDGRAPSLREQALMPIQEHAEMDESLDNVLAKLTNSRRPGSDPGAEAGTGVGGGARSYGEMFAATFATGEITADRLGLALEQFLLTLTSFDSKFDRSLRGEGALNAEERRGFELFMTEYDPRREQFGADCFHCHGGPLFRSQDFANNGLDRAFPDAGRARITGRDADAGKFATPSLRNVALTAPYMHDGRFATLEEVVVHYCTGVKGSATLDPNLAKHPEGGLHLNEEDQRALVAFLKTLTDEE